MHITQLLSGLLESYDFISTPLLNYWCSSLNIVMSIGYHHDIKTYVLLGQVYSCFCISESLRQSFLIQMELVSKPNIQVTNKISLNHEL